ncbi:MAG: fimbrial protein [Fulvimarina manganoxydans]|uniref:fimbrial protein n=1 Tax=Fulvimarina manganoxydans TaxID=937218 RepID=UPI0023568FCE|nr:fimbrial protein [Fulvimarina manganoxydans]MCK5931987.1 fimbrial protein [Fulvimarina manganoxydans]
MQGEDEKDAEKPLDPAVERLRRKMVALLAVSLGFLFLALMTVLGVIIYRTQTGDAPAERLQAPVSIALEPGARATETDLDGDRLAIRIEDASGSRILVYSIATGDRIAEFQLGGSADAE